MIAPSVTLDEGVVIHHADLVNLYGCSIGSGTRIGTFVEIQRNAVIGSNCKISSHAFICEGVTIEEGVFIGHGVMFTNDLYPRAVAPDGRLMTDMDWTVVPTTVKRHAYARAIHAIAPDATVDERACSLFVALAEEGWTDGAIAESVARQYIDPIMAGGRPPDTIVLGCTHFPLLEGPIRAAVGPGPAIVDSATTTAEAVAQRLAADGMLGAPSARATLRLLATDGPDRFAAVGARFLGEPLGAHRVELVDL